MPDQSDAELTQRDMAEIAQARADFYSFLNLHFSTIPDVGFVQKLYDGEVLAALQALVQDDQVEPGISEGASLMVRFLEDHRVLDEAKLSEILGVDRTRLYRGVAQGYGPPPPYEMVWSKTFKGFEALQAVAGKYRESGLEPSEDAKERVDYIGLEMEFMRELALREASAWEAGDEETAQAQLTAQYEFLNQHLGSWAPLFIAKALAVSETDFYRGHMKMVDAYLSAQKEQLDQLVGLV